MSERAPIDLPRVPPRSSRPSRGRQAAVAAAVLAAMAAAAVAGSVLASRDGQEQALPVPSPSAASPSAVPSPAARTPSPSPATDAQGRLVDGTDIGYLQRVSADGRTLRLDRIIFLTGAEAETEAVRRGEEVLDHLVVNDNPLVREYPLDPAAVVTLSIRLAPDAKKEGGDSVPSSVAELRQQLERLPDRAATAPFEVVVRDGRVVGLHEVYLP